jgi:outer membrane protein TolC
MGLGNLAEQRDTRLQYQQARVQQQQAINQVITQVVIAQEQVLRTRERVRTLQAALFDEKGNPGGSVYRSIRLNFLRIRGGQGFPLEVLDATRRLSDVLEAYANALTEYDRARIRLLITLGVPPQTMLDPKSIPLPVKEGTAAR